MNELPDCIPQEQYRPDNYIDYEEELEEDECPHCHNLTMKVGREYDKEDDDFFVEVNKCSQCGYKEEI